MTVQAQIQLRRDTAANWTSEDPTLASGEIGIETDTNKIKIGDGATAWIGLAYFNTAGAGDVVGPAGATADDIAVFNGATGKIIKDGSAKISDLTPTSRTLTGTAPVTVDGDNAAHDLSANRTIAIVAASTSVPGSMSAADKTKLDGIAASAAAVADLTGTAETLGGSAVVGVAATAARSDHKHAITNPALNSLAVPTGDVSLNSHKITNLTNGAAASDAAAFGQIPTALPPNGAAGGDLAGNYPSPTVAQASGAFAFTGVLTPATFGTTQTDYNPAGLSTASVLRLESTANSLLVSLAGGASGRIIRLINVGATYNITLSNNAGGTAAMRFISPTTGVDLVLTPGLGVEMIYDATASRWRILGYMDLSLYAKLASPTFTGDPQAPTPAPGDNDTSIATTAFVATSFAPLASPILTGTPVSVTAAQGTNTTQIATQAAVIQEKLVIEVNANDIFRVDNPGGASIWTGTIIGTPPGASVTVSAPTSGQEAVLVPSSTSQLAKLRLYNLTRGNYALISNYNTGTNVVTLTANAPANWNNNDSLTIASQFCTGAGSWNPIDLEIVSGPTGKSAILMDMLYVGGAAGERLVIHPAVAWSASKAKNLYCQVATVAIETPHPITIAANVFCTYWSGTPTACILREEGYLP